MILSQPAVLKPSLNIGWIFTEFSKQRIYELELSQKPLYIAFGGIFGKSHHHDVPSTCKLLL
jgi:hypothetical protein